MATRESTTAFTVPRHCFLPTTRAAVQELRPVVTIKERFQVRLTLEQRRILRPIFRSVAHHSEYIWCELKREIFDRGCQSQYHWEIEFSQPADRVLKALPECDKSILVADWKKVHSADIPLSDDAILKTYSAIVVEEVVRRAVIASNRTCNW